MFSGETELNLYLRDTNVIKGLFITESEGGLARESLGSLEGRGKPSFWSWSSVISVTGLSKFTSSYSDIFQLDRNSKFGSFT